jgi:hypothetical protein
MMERGVERIGRLVEIERLGRLMEVEGIGSKSKGKNPES